MPLGLKGKVYRVVVRFVVFYGSKCWSLKKIQVQKLMVTKMRMIRWMCGYPKMDRITNGVTEGLVKVAPIEDKLREIRLRWFGQ